MYDAVLLKKVNLKAPSSSIHGKMYTIIARSLHDFSLLAEISKSSQKEGHNWFKGFLIALNMKYLWFAVEFEENAHE